jgi:heme exporter protein D
MAVFAELGPHAGFIVAAYGAAVVLIGGLSIWILADYRRQLRQLAELEARGVKRRSSR